MSNIKLDEVTRVHFIGVGGIGMSALARFFLHEGKVVSGSDRASSAITEALSSEGVEFTPKQSPDNITDDIDLVVYTEGVNEKTEGYGELMAAREKEIETINYFTALGLVVNPYYLIAVAGTHGKTTTTAMLADVLEEASFDPSVVVGSLRTKTRSNYRAGKSKYFVVEACEYKRDFLRLEPDILVITNIELDHVDYYQDLADVQNAFRTLAKKVPADGFIIADVSNPNVKPVLEGVEATVIDYRTFVDLGISLHQPGLHNRLNAAAASATASTLEIEKAVSDKALENFAGTWRRFEYKGEVNGIKVYDDYAHHPTEIAAAIGGSKELYPDKSLMVVFQSHTYTRTSELFDDFVTALAKADRVILLPIYAAREENVSGVSSGKLAEAIMEIGGQAKVVVNPEEGVELAKKITPENGVIITMGAGDMTSKVAEGLVNK
ncbi:MAG: UDP-N-acetylmuramate--L-alanine ligase [Candidatus Nomurabacteria bacterium]|nr:UDP-N-acetylmuramate--L-alanine ligase [Candidatus Nomurabacteria bacterium]USN88151.1 MAG: UDP-N-acetylmuramate--L-alanine ligase [Candidatus Nomurabacteria bacterium]